MSWADDVDAARDKAHASAARAPYAACASVDTEPLTLPMRLILGLVFCLASDLACQTESVELIRIDGPDVHFTATYQRTRVVPSSHGLTASTSSPVR